MRMKAIFDLFLDKSYFHIVIAFVLCPDADLYLTLLF